ncbi:hypothetical protein F4802DRAFT_251074 [Xylaria palmicola]|nr:hypothetical protein F4802DRAFT_251074 [Xylaria palmicola]
MRPFRASIQSIHCLPLRIPLAQASAHGAVSPGLLLLPHICKSLPTARAVYVYLRCFFSLPFPRRPISPLFPSEAAGLAGPLPEWVLAMHAAGSSRPSVPASRCCSRREWRYSLPAYLHLPTLRVHVPCHGGTSPACTGFGRDSNICTWPWTWFGAQILQFSGPRWSSTLPYQIAWAAPCLTLHVSQRRLVPAMYLSLVELPLGLALSRSLPVSTCSSLPLPLPLSLPLARYPLSAHCAGENSSTYSLLLILLTLPVDICPFPIPLGHLLFLVLLFLSLDPNPGLTTRCMSLSRSHTPSFQLPLPHTYHLHTCAHGHLAPTHTPTHTHTHTHTHSGHTTYTSYIFLEISGRTSADPFLTPAAAGPDPTSR